MSTTQGFWPLRSAGHLLSTLALALIVGIGGGGISGYGAGYMQGAALAREFRAAICPGIYIVAVDGMFTVPTSLEEQCEGMGQDVPKAVGACEGLDTIIGRLETHLAKLYEEPAQDLVRPGIASAEYVRDALVDIR